MSWIHAPAHSQFFEAACLYHSVPEDASCFTRSTCQSPCNPHSLNERPALYDYLLVNDSVEECVGRLDHIARRALAGQDAEPGQMPDFINLEDGVVRGSDCSMEVLGRVCGSSYVKQGTEQTCVRSQRAVRAHLLLSGSRQPSPRVCSDCSMRR